MAEPPDTDLVAYTWAWLQTLRGTGHNLGTCGNTHLHTHRNTHLQEDLRRGHTQKLTFPQQGTQMLKVG